MSLQTERIQTRNLLAFSGCFLLSILYFFICSEDLTLLKSSLLFGALIAIPWLMYGCLRLGIFEKVAFIPAGVLLVTLAFPSPKLISAHLDMYLAVGSLLISFLVSYAFLIILVSAIERATGQQLTVSKEL